MKVTKRPKHVKIKRTTFKAVQTSYTCPCCKTFFIGNLLKRVIRFRCDCGQELIIDNGD